MSSLHVSAVCRDTCPKRPGLPPAPKDLRTNCTCQRQLPVCSVCVTSLPGPFSIASLCLRRQRVLWFLRYPTLPTDPAPFLAGSVPCWHVPGCEVGHTTCCQLWACPRPLHSVYGNLTLQGVGSGWAGLAAGSCSKLSQHTQPGSVQPLAGGGLGGRRAGACS